MSRRVDPAITSSVGAEPLAAPAIGETSDKGVDGRDKPGHDGAGRGDRPTRDPFADCRRVYFAKSAP